jgi:hypothetical protein
LIYFQRVQGQRRCASNAPRAGAVALATVVFVLGCACARSVHAEPSANERDTARALMDDADRRRAVGDLYGARERFEAAHAIMHVPTTALELARTQAATAQLIEARATALSGASMPIAVGEPAVFATARAEAAKLATALEPRVPDVAVKSTPLTLEGRFTIDGLELPRAAQLLPIKLNPGAHVIGLEVNGYAPCTHAITLTEGQHAEVTLQLQPQAKPDTAPTVAARTLLEQRPQPTAAVQRSAAYPVARTRGFVAIALAGAVLAAGATTGIVSAFSAANIRDTCNGNACPASLRDRVEVANTLANLTNVLLPVGALGLGYGLFEVFTHPYEEPPPSALQVGLDFHQRGISIRGEL